MERSVSARPGVKKTTKYFEKATREGGKGSRKQCGSFFGDIPVGSLTRFGPGPPSSDLFGRARKKPGCVPDSLGPTMTTGFCSLWLDTRPQSSSPKSYIDQKTLSVIASLS